MNDGTTLLQTAEWLTRFGAGLNLDGGGSTTIVREDEFGNPLVINTPSPPGGVERFNSNNFGVFTNLLAKDGVSVPEPSALGFVFASTLCLTLLRVRDNGELT